MRKESIGRLLLSLLTAIIMVAGVFAAAVYTNYSGMEESPSSPVEASELEMEAREAGEAPVSALEEMGPASFGEQAEVQVAKAYRPNEIEVPAGDEVPKDMFYREETDEKTIKMTHGTRALGIDANGPYGELPPAGVPYTEGDTVPFHAETIPAGEESSHYWNWEVTGDGVWDVNHIAPYGGDGVIGVDYNYPHLYKDNMMAEAQCEAWDGSSWYTVYGDGNVWNELYPPGWYLGAGYYATHGMSFTVNEDLTVDQLGACRYYYPYQYYNIRLWTVGGTLLSQVSYPYLPYYQWSWFNIAPVNLYGGNEYIVSVGIRGYYQCGDDNPGTTADGMVTVNEWRYYPNSPYGFPSYSAGTNPIPLVDIHYSYAYQMPDTHKATAQVVVDNANPYVVDAEAVGAPGTEGDDVGIQAKFYDLGEDDEWWAKCIYGDGTESAWRPIRKYTGGAYVLFCHSYTGDIDPIVTAVANELGPFALGIDQFDFGPLGEGRPPTLDELEPYDVVVVGTNWGPVDSGGMGDVLAEYCKGGGGVVEAVATFYSGGTFSILGDWRDDGYTTMELGGIGAGSSYPGTLLQPHPVMNGVSSWGCSLPIACPGVTAGANYIARYNTNYVAVATRDEDTLPDGNGRVVGTNVFYPSGYVSGDAYKLLANSIKWASQQPDPEPIPQPIPTGVFWHTYADDHPTHVTSLDVFPAVVKVKDDDHEKTVVVGSPTILDYVDFEASTSWPAGWYEAGDYAFTLHYPYELFGVRCAFRTYYPYGISYLYSPIYDFSALGGAIVDWWSWWYTGWSGAHQDGYVQIRAGSGPWTTLWEAHHNDPTEALEYLNEAFGPAAGSSQVQLRFMIDMYNDWYWEFDNIQIMSAATYMMTGIGEDGCDVPIQNSIPWLYVPDTHVRVTDENTPITFEGMEIRDKALWVPTEEFMYKILWGDGQESPWHYKGSMAPPKLDILLMHWVELSSNSGPDLTPLANAIYATDMVNTLDFWNFGPYMNSGPPSVSTMGNYDVIVYASNWGQFSTLWDIIRTQNGNNLADYQDIYGGGVVTLMATYDNSMYYGDLFTMRGRYIDDDYGAFEKEVYPFGDGNLDPASVVPDEVTYEVDELVSSLIHSGDYPLTVGGGGQAAGCNGVELARWTDGNMALGKKELNNGARSVNIGQGVYAPGIGQDDIERLMLNSLGWTSNVYIPTPVLPTHEHVYADNGIYEVNYKIIDDDMWYYWPIPAPWPPEFYPVPDPFPDPINMPPPCDNFIETEIYNVDPTILNVGATATVDLMLRMTGTKNTDCTMRLMNYGGMTPEVVGEVTVTRVPGSPNMDGFTATLDMGAGSYYQLELDCTGGTGGNPTWIVDLVWPDGKFKELKFTFNDEHGWSAVVPDFKSMMVGHPIDFQVDCEDVGSDDLAVVMNYGDGLGCNLHANTGTALLGAPITVAGPNLFTGLPNREPVFVREPNDIRSPWGGPTLGIQSRFTHTFSSGGCKPVGVTVWDDDCKQIPPYLENEEENLLDGCDADVFECDL
jgi:hypothetical protein